MFSFFQLFPVFGSCCPTFFPQFPSLPRPSSLPVRAAIPPDLPLCRDSSRERQFSEDCNSEQMLIFLGDFLGGNSPAWLSQDTPILCHTRGWCCSGICKPCSSEPGSAQPRLKQQQPHCCKGWVNSLRHARDETINSSR